MGKNLHYSIMPFILEKMKGHQNVEYVKDISTSEYYIYRLIRTNDLRDVVVVIDDSYHYGEFDYLSRPPQLNEGGFILIAKPESSFRTEDVEYHKEDKIIVGKIGTLLGALRIDEYWTYERPVEVKKK